MPSQSLSAPSHGTSSGAGVSGPAGWMSTLSSRQSLSDWFESHRAYFASPYNLGEFILADYIRNRRRRIR